MAAEFYNYNEDKGIWFGLYMELAAAICAYPSLSVKNSEFADNLRELVFPLELEEEVKLYGTHGSK